MTRNNVRLIRLAGGLIAGAVVLTGCSGGSDTSDRSARSSASQSADQSADFNDADVAFAQGMIVHHKGALEMAQLADGRAQDPRVLDLAGRIEAAQNPEIQTMTGWLEDWDQPTSPAQSSGMSGGMNMGGMNMDMAGLEAASGPEFDRMWLQMMTEHHKGAVDMAQTEIADGQNSDAIALAEQIVKSQSAEIDEMGTLLTELGG